MSINWVMLNERRGFVHLPNERLLYTSPPRTGFALQPPPSYTGNDKLSLRSSSGQIFLTNQRVIYIPAQRVDELESFSAPLLNLHDSHVSSPFFGPNVWNAVVQPVPGGGIPPSLVAVHLKVTFKEGGAFDFHNQFERIKERLQQAVEISRESGRGAGDINMAGVHLEELPAYSGPQSYSTEDNHSNRAISRQNTSETNTEPQEPPPGYEEVQQQSVANELEERLRRAS
ncbi:hypothetical protein AN5598.2 [Aspergillus nidulans FGSC A4]|uniref:Uncharacterized protein n=1 Tax=Emericella nidulans (strain FGSC A4 / ATCC 38163 / CBS 112.46 / NRRL 194 / M139) TaxID=227321 RepID=Q5B1I2_EMENI|nr:hypothetical protein [Aspergillus nidulans FGSC A4]EAA62241.1 hypothetical protein AN5598.2 [Aspergillus nidulans FGSC A4]CBF81590.1 TPA: conserved hypothetical protein [Aspergillus nidulans FGSC A4]|eukprot:XP_663202.1 hypothetical protein AN5598.2 [Aspergillus nidulans FGSC A4]